MSPYSAVIVWHRDGQSFSDRRYRRQHEWRFDGGAVVAASSSPTVVPLPMSDPPPETQDVPAQPF